MLRKSQNESIIRHMNKHETELKREEDRKRAEDHAKQLEMDCEKLLTLPEFKRYMADVLRKGGMFRSVMTGNSHTYYQSGRQDFTREIWAGLAQVNQGLAFELLKTDFGEK